MKPLIVLGVATVTGLGAQASPCSAGHFTDEHGKTYLSAETALLEDEAPGRAVSILDTLQASGLNCYEALATHRMKAAALVELKDFESAIAELKIVLEHPLLSTEEKAREAYNIGQLYRVLGDQEAAAPYLDMSETLNAGAKDD